MLNPPPPFSQIEGNLWLGACPSGIAPPEFKHIVCLHPWDQYVHKLGRDWHAHTMIDSAEAPDLRLLEYLADLVNCCRARAPTLVHCTQGINRSSLVVGFALVRSGMSAEAAIALMRSKRDQRVLSNKVFEALLLAQRP